MYHYYAILGLPTTATGEDIKKAYRALAKQYHPDIVGNTPEAIRRFQEIGQAYEYLMAVINRPPPMAYPHNPSQYYSPYQPQQHSPPDNNFQSYTWEPMKEEPRKYSKPKPQEPKPKAKAEPVVEEKQPFVSMLSKELLLASRLEASQEAVRRVVMEKPNPKDELQSKVNLYLKEEYAVTSGFGSLGFTVTSNKSGKKVSVRPNLGKKTGGKSSFFGGKSSLK